MDTTIRTKNINELQAKSLSFNERLAMRISSFVGSMQCAYIFALLALVSLPEAIHLGLYALVAWVAQTFLQLVLLSIIMVGQNLQNRHSEIRAENDYAVNMKAEKEIAEMQERVLRIESMLIEKLYARTNQR